MPFVSKRRTLAGPAALEPTAMFTVPYWPSAPTPRLTPPTPALPLKAKKLAVGLSTPFS